jgi:acyl-coenzyme A thioesterase PaaI-like protein
VSSGSAIRHTVLRALALNRTPGYHFTGHFLDVSHDRVSVESARTSMKVGAHCSDRNGGIDYGALAVFADLSMAANVRAGHDLATRLATATLNMNFTGAPMTTRIEAQTSLQGYLLNSTGRQAAAVFTVRAGGQVSCFGTGAFMVLDPPKGQTLHARRLRTEQDEEVAPLEESELAGDELAILQGADDALSTRDGEAFIRRFWGISTQSLADRAAGTLKNGPQVSNRVGHVQGGVTMALGIATAQAALPSNWMLSAVSAWFVGPCEGELIEAQSDIVHQGKLTSVVRTRITGKNSRQAMEMVTTHAHKAD